jgi:hypothetical protein
MSPAEVSDRPLSARGALDAQGRVTVFVTTGADGAAWTRVLASDAVGAEITDAVVDMNRRSQAIVALTPGARGRGSFRLRGALANGRRVSRAFAFAVADGAVTVAPLRLARPSRMRYPAARKRGRRP